MSMNYIPRALRVAAAWAVLALNSSAQAQSTAGDLYLKLGGLDAPQVIDASTGKASKFIEVMEGFQPLVCPKDAFYGDKMKAFSCASGYIYRLVPAGEGAVPGADYRLEAISGGTETDEHPPMKYPPPSEDVKP